jgi:hypothetical protein
VDAPRACDGAGGADRAVRRCGMAQQRSDVAGTDGVNRGWINVCIKGPARSVTWCRMLAERRCGRSTPGPSADACGARCAGPPVRSADSRRGLRRWLSLPSKPLPVASTPACPHCGQPMTHLGYVPAPAASVIIHDRSETNSTRAASDHGALLQARCGPLAFHDGPTVRRRRFAPTAKIDAFQSFPRRFQHEDPASTRRRAPSGILHDDARRPIQPRERSPESVRRNAKPYSEPPTAHRRSLSQGAPGYLNED